MPAIAEELAWFEAAAGMLRRIVPPNPPFPLASKRRPMRGEADAGIIDDATSYGGDPPEPPDDPPFDVDAEPPIEVDPIDPDDPDDGPDLDTDTPDGIDPEDPDDPDDGPDLDTETPGDPIDPFDWDWIDVDAERPAEGEGEAPDAGDTLTRPQQATFTDLFDQPGTGILQSQPGAWWKQVRGTWVVSTGCLRITSVESAGVPLAAVLYVPWTYTDCSIGVVLDNVTAGAIKYVLARMDENGNGYAAALTGATGLSGRIYRLAGWAIAATLVSFPVSVWAIGDTMELRCTGPLIEVYKNGVLHISAVDATHASGLLGIGGGSAVPAYRSALLTP